MNVQIGDIFNYKSKDFTMYPYVEVLGVGKTHAFVVVLYPKSWGLKRCETTFSLTKLENEYHKVDSYNKDFYSAD